MPPESPCPLDSRRWRRTSVRRPAEALGRVRPCAGPDRWPMMGGQRGELSRNLNMATRKYHRAVRLPEGDLAKARGDGTSKSAVSRLGKKMSGCRRSRRWQRRLVLEGATENTVVVQALIDNLLARGLDPTLPRLSSSMARRRYIIEASGTAKRLLPEQGQTRSSPSSASQPHELRRSLASEARNVKRWSERDGAQPPPACLLRNAQHLLTPTVPVDRRDIAASSTLLPMLSRWPRNVARAQRTPFQIAKLRTGTGGDSRWSRSGRCRPYPLGRHGSG